MAARRGRVLKAIGDKPKLSGELLFYHTAFCELDSERNHGMGLMKIPRSAMVAFAAECGLSENEKHELIYVMRKVDDAHLEHLHEKLDTKARLNA